MSRAQLTSTVEQNTGGAVAPVVAGKNKIANGDFSIFQRGTTISVGVAAKTYTADRWWLYTNELASVSQQSSGLTGFRYCARVQRTSGQGAGGIYFSQPVETANSVALASQTVTFSFYARAGSGMSASNLLNYSLSTGTGTDESGLGGYTGNATPINSSVTLLATGSGGISGTGWQRITASATLASTATEFGITFGYNATGTAGANDYFEVTGVQVEVGAVATPFTLATATLQGELSLCQRYLPVIAKGADGIWLGASTSTTVTRFTLPFTVTPRVAPTGIVVAGSFALYNSAFSVSGGPTITYAAGSTSSILIDSTTTAGAPTLVSGTSAWLYGVNSAALIYATGCEL